MKRMGLTFMMFVFLIYCTYANNHGILASPLLRESEHTALIEQLTGAHLYHALQDETFMDYAIDSATITSDGLMIKYIGTKLSLAVIPRSGTTEDRTIHDALVKTLAPLLSEEEIQTPLVYHFAFYSKSNQYLDTVDLYTYELRYERNQTN